MRDDDEAAGGAGDAGPHSGSQGTPSEGAAAHGEGACTGGGERDSGAGSADGPGGADDAAVDPDTDSRDVDQIARALRLAPEADRLYLQFRATAGDPDAEFAAFTAQHPEHAEHHRMLHENYEGLKASVQRMMDGGGGLVDQLAAFADYSHSLSVCGIPVALDPEALERLRDDDFSTRYELVREIHRSRMSVLLEVFDHRLQRTCAMKVMLDRTEVVRGEEDAFKLLAEALITAQLEHPAIVPIQDVGFDAAGRLCFIMKLIRGQTFEEVLAAVGDREDGWTLNRALDVLVRIADALEYAHGRGVSHMDIKPANIMVGRHGEATLMDWGLHTRHSDADEPEEDDAARGEGEGLAAAGGGTSQGEDRDGAEADEGAPRDEQQRGEGGSVATATALEDGALAGARIDIGPRGTPLYMSPEQARNLEHLLGPASDIYSLGVVLYHLISGRTPYLDPQEPPVTLWTIIRRVASDDVQAPPLAELAPDAPSELAAICERAIQPEIPDRYASVDELREALVQYLRDQGEERQEALRQARRARANARLLRDILAFGQTNNVSGDRDFTVRQAMDATHQQLREAPPPNAGDRADLALMLGELYSDRGLLDTAVELLTEAQELLTAEHGPRHPDALGAASLLAWVHYMQGDVDGSVDELEAVHRAQCEELGELSPDTLLTLWRRAQASEKSGLDLAEAQALYRQARDGYAEIDGPDSVGALNAEAARARVIKKRGRPADAIPFMERALEGMLRVHGAHHTSTLIQQNDLAMAYLAARRSQEAETLFRHVIARQEGILEVGHFHTETTRNNLGMALLDQGRAEEALPLLERGYAAKVRHIGWRHPDARIMKYNIALACEALGDVSRAERLLRHCVRLQEHAGDQPAILARVLTALGRVLIARQRCDRAREVLDRAAGIFATLQVAQEWRDELAALQAGLDGAGAGSPDDAGDATGEGGVDG